MTSLILTVSLQVTSESPGSRPLQALNIEITNPFTGVQIVDRDAPVSNLDFGQPQVCTLAISDISTGPLCRITRGPCGSRRQALCLRQFKEP